MPSKAEDYVVWLDQPGAESAALVGSKAANLARLSRAGLPVPDGFCLTLRAYHDWAAIDAPGAGGATAGLGKTVTPAPLPPALAAQVLEAFRLLRRRCGGVRVAVRSSALLEDLADASFAGQYTSVLNVSGEEELLLAVGQCWASALSPQAQLYRTQRGVGQGQAGMAVIVQAMAPAAQAGVAFTIDPISGRGDVIVVEAIAGTGQALLSGEAAPHRYVCRRADCCSELADELLDATRLAAVVSLARKVESWAGRPQDIEWALDQAGGAHLLQARPITTPAAQPNSERVTRWTRDNVAEVIPDAVTPLSWSELDPLTNRSFQRALRRLGASTLAGSCLFGRFYGRVYFNRSVFQELMERFYPSRAGWRAAPRLAWTGLKGWWALYRLPRECSTISRTILGRHHAQRELTLADLTETPVLARLEEWRRLSAAAMDVHLTVMVLAELLYQALDKLLARWVHGHPAACAASVTAGLKGVLSAEAGRALASLAQRVRADESLRALVLGASPEALPEGLARTESGRELWTGIQSFLSDYGYGAVQEFELAAPRWRDDPALVLAALQAQVRAWAGIPAADPAAARLAAIHRIESQVGPLERRLFRILLRRAQLFTVARENLKYCIVLAHGHLRDAYQALARGLVHNGRLAATEDVFFLTAEEVVALVSGRASDGVQERIAERREAWQADHASSPPAALDETERWVRPAASALAPPAGDGQLLHGVGGSPGAFAGRARVLHVPEDGAAMEPGEILVTQATSPGWAPLFLSAGALVTEVGGLLSHGAIIAREYGLPAVLNVAGATQRIHTGQPIAVDGTRGTVRLLGE